MNNHSNYLPLLRIEKEDINNAKRYKVVEKTKLQTTNYNLVFFYKPITKIIFPTINGR
jgi:hypothetical protein